MNFATWSIRNPIPVIVVFVMLAAAGFWGFAKLPIQNLPDLDLPTITITASQPGAAPAQLETEVARKIEDSVATLAGIKHMRTLITDGQVSISAEFVLEKRISDALIETKDAVDRVRSGMPADLQQPTVSAVRAGSEVLMTYVVAAADMTEEALSWFIDDTASKAMLAVPGVGRFERFGGGQREVRIEVDPARLAAVGATAADVSRALRQVEQDSSGGRSQLGRGEQAIRTIGTVKEAAELTRLPVALADGRQIRLDQVAVVKDTLAERAQVALLDGKRVVGFNIFRSTGSDETRIAVGVKTALSDLQVAHPDLKVTLISSRVAHTLAQYRGSMHMLYEGAILAVLVVWLFLRDWRATLIAASALPLSILPAFAAMAVLGYSLNTLTLLALAVVVGILVDDAIVEIENIERHGQMGKSMREATADAVTEIALAVIATTLTLVAVFVPTTMMPGIAGLFFRQFGWTVVVAVLASLLVARLLVPMLAANLLTIPLKKEAAEDGWIMRRYLAAVRWCLARQGITAAAAGAFLMGSFALLTLIPSGFVPASDEGHTTLSIELPPGSSIVDTLAVAEAARLAVKDVDGIANVLTSVGSAQAAGAGAVQAGEVRKATLTLTLTAAGSRPKQQAIEKEIRARMVKVAGARFAQGGGGSGRTFSLMLTGDDARALKSAAQAIERDLRRVPGLSNVASTASLERPELTIRPDSQRMSERGVTTSDIGTTIRIATGGDFDAQLAKLNLDNRQVQIRVQMADEVRRDFEAIQNLRVNASDGAVPLSSIASLSIESGPSQIDRYDRRRYVTVNADLGGVPIGTASAAAKALPSVKTMPSSVKFQSSGEVERMGELMSGFGMALVSALLLILCVLVVLFKDFLQPITILSAIPLAAGGALVALLLAGSELDVPSMIGLVMLVGIVTKNSILLVEYAIVGMRDRSLSVTDALVDACHKRARPIVMTSVAMIAGMLPIALGLGADASFRQPMAITVIGGLITSTALSLLVVPVVFTLVHRFETRLKSTFQRSAPALPAYVPKRPGNPGGFNP